MPSLALAVFVAVFVIATLRNIHLGVLMFPAAIAVGLGLAGMSAADVLGNFPVNILFLVGGVTYFFGIAQANGTIDVLIQKLIAAVGDRRALLPFVLFLITTGVASMGSSQAGYVMIPLAMAAARRSAVDPVVMGVALNSGMSTGGFAPTSLFGIITVDFAEKNGIYLNPFTLLAAAAIANLALLVVAAWMFPGPGRAIAPRDSAIEPAATAARLRFSSQQVVTLACIGVMFLTVVTVIALTDRDSNRATAVAAALGTIAFGLGAVLALMWPAAGAEGIRRIDWSTIFLVGAIVTFVQVLEHMEAVDLLGGKAVELGNLVGTPLVGAFVICIVAGLASAFASTNGILTTLVPIALPLAMTGNVADWALLTALGVCASIVDVSPFSTTGALVVEAAAAGERPRLKSLLMRWGLSMVIVGPAVAVIVLALIGGRG